MRSCDYLIKDVVVNGPFVLMRKIRRSEKMEPKLRIEWIDVEVKKI